MAQFSVNTHRFDPYKNMKFRVKWDGRYVAGVSKVSPLSRTTEPVTHREGGDPVVMRQSPGNQKYEPITLERGVTHDTEFEAWANLVYSTTDGIPLSLKGFRRDITIELHNEAGKVVKGYKVFRCWVSEYQALPELDANGAGVAIEKMVLVHEGWERDVEVAEPAET
jgi:phage tail-like protein